jgi:hypothetical protein
MLGLRSAGTDQKPTAPETIASSLTNSLVKEAEIKTELIHGAPSVRRKQITPQRNTVNAGHVG